MVVMADAITLRITYVERVALPYDAEIIALIKEGDTLHAKVVGQWSLKTAGRQVPITMVLAGLPRVKNSQPLFVDVKVYVRGRVWFITSMPMRLSDGANQTLEVRVVRAK